MAHSALIDLELPVLTGMRILAVRGGDGWTTAVSGETILVPDDVLFLEGPPAGIPTVRELAGAPPRQPIPETEPIEELDRAIDILVEMKNLSEAAVGLAYSALVLGDRGLAAEVRHLETRLDEMHDQLETWVLRAAASSSEPSPLRGLLHLAAASEDIGDQASAMVMFVERGEEVHPVLGVALAEADEVVLRLPVAAGSEAEGRSLAELQLDVAPGYMVLAIKTGSTYRHRPSGRDQLTVNDEVIASGPDEGREQLAQVFGWKLVADDDAGDHELAPL